MAKFAINDTSTLVFNSNSLTCLIDVTLDDSVDTIVSECFGATDFKEQILAGRTVSGSLTQEIADDDVTQLTYTVPKTAGTLVFEPAGSTTGDIRITSTNMQITVRSLSLSRSGLLQNSVTFVCDDVTFLAIPA